MRTLPFIVIAVMSLSLPPLCPAQDDNPDEPKMTKAQERAAERAAKRAAKHNKDGKDADDSADDKDGKGGKAKSKDKEIEKTEYQKSGKGFDFTKEFAALDEGAALLAEVADEKSAQRVAKKLCSMFNLLPIPMGGSEKELELWAKTANRLNRQMERLKKEEWFVSSGLQQAWTLATDPFSRRKAQK